MRTLLAFSIPTMITNVLQTLGGTVNMIWVGQLLGDKALAATANANIVMFLTFSVIFGMGTAAAVKIGQYFGARDYDGARRVFGTGIGVCVVIAIAIGVVGWFVADPLLRTLATPAVVHDAAVDYLRVIFLTMIFVAVSMMISMALRGAGDTRTSLHAMILTTALNIVLVPVLIVGLGPLPGFGIAGAALANGIGSFFGIVVMVCRIYWRDMPIRLKGSELSYLLTRSAELRYVVGKGIPSGGQMAVSSLAAVVMVGLVNREGLMAAAAYGALLQIWSYIQMPAFAISMAVSAMVAQNIGAGKPERAHPVTMAGVKANVLLTGVLTALLMVFDKPLLSLFLGAGSAALPIAEHVQVIGTWTYILIGITMVLSGVMRAYGVVMLPLIATIIAMYPGRLGFYFIAYPYIGGEAIWWALPAGSIAATSLTWLAFWYTSPRPSVERATQPAAMAAE